MRVYSSFNSLRQQYDMGVMGTTMRTLPEDVRVRQAVAEGIGRGLRELLRKDREEPLPAKQARTGDAFVMR